MRSDSKALSWTSGKLVLAAVVLASATGAAFAGWLNNTDGIFLSLVESGLSWCM